MPQEAWIFLIVCCAVMGGGLLLLIKCAEAIHKWIYQKWSSSVEQATSVKSTPPAVAARPPAFSQPAIARSEVDALKARLLGLVDERDARLEEIAASNEPPEVKEEKMRAVLQESRRQITEA